MCTSIQNQNGILQLSHDVSDEIKGVVKDMAMKLLRVIAFAYYEMDEDQYNAQFE